jgi:carboxymethylenebutenolidase
MMMNRMRSRDMPDRPPRDAIALYDAFTHGAINRREFLDRLAKVAGSTAAATLLLPVLANDYASAALLAAEDDDRLKIFTSKFDTGDIVDIFEPEDATKGPTRHLPFVTAYGARPREKSIAPAVIVIHENRGLNPHIKDIARRIALEGFHAFAVDMLSPYGGTPADEDAARAMIGKLNPDKTVAKFSAIVQKLALLKTHQRQVGAIGFCWGGGMVNRLAAASAALKAGVCYYGRSPSDEEAARIRARMLLHYAGNDARINEGVPAYEAALKTAGVDYQLHMYEGVEHAFNNDANAARYNKEAADLAWARTIAFLKETLSA